MTGGGKRPLSGGLLVAAIAVLGLGGAVDEAAASDALDRLKAIHQMVMDPAQTFSIRATLGELDEIEPGLAESDIEARGELNYLRGFVLFRAGRAEESLPPSQEALRIDAQSPFLAPRERSRFFYHLASQAEDLAEWDIAIASYRKAIALFDDDPEVSEDQRLGTRERLAYCLHEAGDFAGALEINRQVLAGGETLFGSDSEKLLVVITNMAQNAHGLEQPDVADKFLQRRLDIASRHGNERHIDESLFQLGVVAFEQGQTEQAETFMKRRLKLAEASGDQERIADAREALDVLHEKMGK
ncbi:hypothetical protein NA8A_05393 [Nitratireductor indicus C115]|uniref:Tetratricopeptide repeat protein n=1 Tax=Nitratireductor indicus C115 TaxID=1231190 RepID=K2NVR4_9HYPH|nr:tetratricopeptide repeat protein [Nitratireductor indicus]EKF43440.1 hypothetical protein NA8A_05393 [Nitratireductor indicus C115]SFQ07581.1 Tetratricopeptide repeat-containing protein [Nitratireductor indicus]